MAIDLNKSVKVNLAKNQKLDLTKGSVGTVTRARLALGWDPAGQAAPAKKSGGLFGGLRNAAAAVSGGGEIDLDAGIVALDASGQVLDVVYYGQLNSRIDGSIQHNGDNLTGAGEGDDETINIDLSRVDARVAHLACVITSYSGQTFNQVQNVFCRLDDMSAGNPVPVTKYDLQEQPNAKGMVMAIISRTATGGWEMAAKGTPVTEARTARDASVVTAVRASL